jgi:hypothetical protein
MIKWKLRRGETSICQTNIFTEAGGKSGSISVNTASGWSTEQLCRALTPYRLLLTKCSSALNSVDPVSVRGGALEARPENPVISSACVLHQRGNTILSSRLRTVRHLDNHFKLTPWGWILHEKPPVAHLLKNFPTYYGSRRLSHRRLGLPTILLPSGLPSKFLRVFLFSMPASYSAHLVLLDLIKHRRLTTLRTSTASSRNSYAIITVQVMKLLIM